MIFHNPFVVSRGIDGMPTRRSVTCVRTNWIFAQVGPFPALTYMLRTDGRTIENPKQLHRAYIVVVVAALHIAHARRTCLAVGSWRRKRCQEWHSSRRCHLNYFSIWGRNLTETRLKKKRIIVVLLGHDHAMDFIKSLDLKKLPRCIWSFSVISAMHVIQISIK